MGFSATKWAAQIVPLGVTWVCDETDATIGALGHTWPQLGFLPQGGVQNTIIHLYEISDPVFTVPTRRDLVLLLDFDC